MSFDLLDLIPSLGALALALAVPLLGDRSSTAQRSAYGVAVAAAAFAHLQWRIGETLIPEGPGEIGLWPFVVFAVELAGLFTGLVFIMMMARAPRRVGPETRPSAEIGTPWVDIVIPTYDEPRDVVDKAIIAALAQDHPKVRVHVLDDGDRDWLRDLCAELGATHHVRSDRRHAKAGNLNAALPKLHGEFVAIMDADFAAARNFVSRTLPLFADPEIGIVQTPQVFYNSDVVQLNLGLARHWVDEQRFFFGEIMPARARWDAAFSCGSCSMNRRAALDAVGGFPTESITEDMLTSLRMRRAGYRTVYLNENLALGLSADGAQGHFLQRERWARGNIQILFLKDDLIGNPRLDPLQRLFFTPLHWLTAPLVTVTAVIVPVLHFLFGLSPLNGGTVEGTLSRTLPFLILQQGYMIWISNGTHLPVVSAAIRIFQSFRLLPGVIASVIRPFGAPFRVTPKGSASTGAADLLTAGILAGLWTATAVGLALEAVPSADRSDFSAAAVLWAVLLLPALTVALLIAIPRRHLRMSERFTIDLDLTAETSAGIGTVRVEDMSTGGAALLVPPAAPLRRRSGESAALILPDGTRLEGRLIRRGDRLALHWGELPPLAHRRLVEFLFSGRFSSVPLQVRDEAALYGTILRTLWN